MQDILLSHSGKQHCYKLALSLDKLGRLGRLATSTYYDPVRFPDRIFLRFRQADSFLRKRHENGLSDKVARFPFFEIPELILRLLFGNSRIAQEAVCARDALFDKFVSATQMREWGIFWGFQGSCLESLKSARRKKILAIVEFATGHVEAAIDILEKERLKNPEWKDSINNLYFPDWYLKRLREEPFYADYCVVASEFSGKTLESAGVGKSKILRLPLGVDIDKFVFKKRAIKDKFRILFVGGIGQRKGIKYLLDAVKKLDSSNIILKIAGPVIGSGRAFRSYSGYYNYLGTLGTDQVIKAMHESDCLVLPSLFEGFGLVIPEAMATGMPVIASTSSAAPEIIREGIDGFLAEPADTDGLAAKLEWLLKNRKKAVKMGENARERVKAFSWDRHIERLKHLLEIVERGK